MPFRARSPRPPLRPRDVPLDSRTIKFAQKGMQTPSWLRTVPGFAVRAEMGGLNRDPCAPFCVKGTARQSCGMSRERKRGPEGPRAKGKGHATLRSPSLRFRVNEAVWKLGAGVPKGKILVHKLITWYRWL